MVDMAALACQRTEDCRTSSPRPIVGMIHVFRAYLDMKVDRQWHRTILQDRG